MDRKKRYVDQKGSFTVEITFIMPLLLTIVTALLFLVMHMYNQGVIYSAASRGSKQIFYYISESNNEIEENCSKVLLADLEKRLVCMDMLDAEVKVSATKVKIHVSGRLNVPLFVATPIFGMDKLWNYDIVCEEIRIHPAEILLYGQQFENIYNEKIKGESEDGDEI